MSFTVGYLIYIVLCIIGLHIGINYLYSVHTTRKVQGKDLLFALACVLLNVLLLAYLVNKDGKISAGDYVLIKNYIMRGTEFSL